MRPLISTPRFERSHRKFVRHDRELQRRIEQTLVQMQEDVFAPTLGTHKLSGEFYGLWACSCGYDCRIVFSIERDEIAQQERIILQTIGTHDQVY